ncbi:hypothetical protein M5689_020395 [Euphorbia peplus]|nr:hypothetical protein M5689_020395 [Euphorbia peplus]
MEPINVPKEVLLGKKAIQESGVFSSKGSGLRKVKMKRLAHSGVEGVELARGLNDTVNGLMESSKRGRDDDLVMKDRVGGLPVKKTMFGDS